MKFDEDKELGSQLRNQKHNTALIPRKSNKGSEFSYSSGSNSIYQNQTELQNNLQEKYYNNNKITLRENFTCHP